MQANAALTGADELASKDLGPLAWVLDELRKSLDGATRALRRFVRDAELARGLDLAALDASQLRIARQQLHQAVGALEMVGLAVPAKILRAMEALAQRFVQSPELCSDDAANKMERASFALTEYLEGVLKGKSASAVALFPQYRDVRELAGHERVHPADLWLLELRWIDVALPIEEAPLANDPSVRIRVDSCILKVFKSGDAGAAKSMRDLSLGFAAGQVTPQTRTYWKICAAYFEAVSLGLCPFDIYGKWTVSRVLLQERGLSRGDSEISERLVQDLLFFCAQAIPDSSVDAPVLNAVRAAYGLTQTTSFDYEVPRFGRFDPALLALARKRIAAATETWSALAGGDTNRLKLAIEQFGLLTDSVLKLHPESGDLARALHRAIDTTARSGEAPPPALAMEVATVVLYLEAAYEDLDPTDSHMTERAASLARRLEHVNAGGQPEPLEKWMEDLYRRVSDRQIMGSVVGELRTTLGQIERSLDLFFRDPLDRVPLQEVPSQLSQMRGVFSVLGLDQAALASLRMRSSVEHFLVDEAAVVDHTATFVKIGNSLGAIGFLIDMLSYQRELAKKLFVYDEELSEFKPLMGTGKALLPEAKVVAPLIAATPPQVPPPSFELPEIDVAEDEDAIDLKDIFLEEARDVLQAGLLALKELAENPADMGQLTSVRRVFHMLKGSSRMVGLNDFGEAAWSMEQLLNAWLAEQKPASSELQSLAVKALHGFESWVEDIASNAGAPWSPQAFRDAADALRLHGAMVQLVLPGERVAISAAQDQSPPAIAATEMLEFGATEVFDGVPAVTPDGDVALPLLEPGSSALLDLDGLDFGDISATDPSAFGVSSTAMEDEGLSSESGAAEGAEVDDQIAAQQVKLVGQDPEDQIKLIGTLRIGIPLYNVYLNEADEWSRRLLTELNEWALELHRPVFDSTVGLAHSLAGSSATVGFVALSSIARALEQALRHVQFHARGIPEHVNVFIVAAEDIRRLLHQFAAGFLREPDPSSIAALKAILELEFPAGTGAAPDDWYSEQSLESEYATESGLEQTPGLTAEVALTDDEEEGIELVDALDVDLFAIFEEETLEMLPQLGGALRQWTARPENLGARNEVLRVLHTLKGSARLAGAMRLGEMSHRMESAIEQLGMEIFQPHQLDSLLTRFDRIQADFERLRSDPEVARSLPEVRPMAQDMDSVSNELPASVEPISMPVAVSPIFTPLAPLRQLPSQTVRVRSQLLDHMVNQAGEVMITRSRLDARLGQLRGSLDELTGNLDRLRNQLRDIEVQSESQMQSRLAQTKDSAQGFDPLEFDRFTRVQELTRMMAESVHDVATVQRNLQRTVEGAEDDLIAQGRQARELQRDLLRTRMVEFEGIAERLYSVVRQASKDANKQVKLDIQGGSLDMDRGVLDRLTPAFEHLLRNAVAHGIEDPEQRVAAGKPVVGTITIHLYQQSNDVTVEFRDDGAGLDLDRIRGQAHSDGMSSEGSALSDAEATNLIFMPGFSTASSVTELAGRGIGLDVVRAEVNALGGRIETSTERGQGTWFKLILPLTTAVTQVVMLRIGTQVFGVPATLIEMVRRVPVADLERAYQDNVFDFNGEKVPFFWAGALLQASAQSSEKRTKTLVVTIFRSAGQRLAAHVDEVLGNQEVVVKNLGPQLSRLPGLVGMSVLASGTVVLIYNPVALASVYGEQARLLKLNADQAGRLSTSLLASVSQTPLILVVDDSITVRRVTQRLLKREGFRVALAADGLQALERLREEKPAVVLSDIEMPRMDGFELTRNIRGDAKLRDLPIIMITSRIAQKHREHARELGIDHYLGKPYSEEELIGLVRQYCATPVATEE